MLKPVAAALVLLGSFAAAQAAPSCFRQSEIEADQALRFRADLMVLSDTCRTDSYRRFMRRNGDLVGAYQQRMIEHFRRSEGDRAEAAFDRYITTLANEAALRHGGELRPSLCAGETDFLGHARRLDPGGFGRYAAERAAERRRDYRRCADEGRSSP